MVQNRIIFFATSVQPNPEEIDYWVDLSDNPYGGSIKYFNGTKWVRLAASGGTPDLSNYYTKTQVNKLLNDKANISDVDSKADDEEVKDVIKDIQFDTSNPNGITMVMFKYNGSNKTVSIPVTSTSSAGIITSKDFLDFVKQHQLQELHTEMIDTFADIRAKYQKKLIAGLNIKIDQETNVISASGDLAVQWDNITNKPDFKPVATSGDYNDLINKLKPGKDVSISEDNTISIAIDSDSLEQSLATLQSNIDKEAATARAAETKLGNDIATEKNRAESAESANATAIANEVERATGVEETLNSNITQLQTQKVDKVEGKGLSTNDYTTPEKNKLAAIEAEANKYVLPAATTTTLGGIIVGDRLSIDNTGKLVATYTYTLPTASNTVLGGVKIGSNITLADGGTISITKNNVTSALGVDPTTTYVKKAGDTMTGALTNSSTISGSKLISTVSTGTAPIQVSSTTLCTNLNADMVDGKNASDFQPSLQKTLKFTTNTSNSKVVWCDLCRIAQGYQNYSILVQISALQSAVLCSVVVGYQGVSINILNSIITGNQQFNQVYPTLRVVNRDNQNWLQCTFQQGTTDQNNGNNLMSVNITTSDNKITLVDSLQEDTMEYTNAQIYGYASVSNNFGASMNIGSGEVVDWYGVRWSEASSNPDCTRIGNMEMHRTLPIQSMMKPFAFNCGQPHFKDQYVPVKENFTSGQYSHNVNDSLSQATNDVNIMIKIPEFWYTDDYNFNTKTHNLKICQHAKSGWNHHKEAYVSAYELYNLNGRAISKRENIPTVNFTRANGRTWARANGFDGEAKWNLYTYEEHRAICHLFLVEYATRNSQKAVNTALTTEGFRQGGLGSGCTTGTATINGAATYSFIPTGSSDSLGSGSGEVTVTIQQTDSSGHNTSTITRKCNRYRGIENPFGHVWKHIDDVISIYSGGYRTWYKSIKPEQFANNKNTSYKPLTTATVVTGFKTEIRATPTCDFFAAACTNGSESTYWCDYNWDNTGTLDHCLLIGSDSGGAGGAGLFYLASADGVGASSANVGSRLTYLPWAE